MGYGKPDITVPSQCPTFHQQVEDKFSPYAKETLAKLISFLEEEVWPAERLARAQLPNDARRWQTVIPVIKELKAKARKLGLWNLFLSKAHYPEHGVPLTNLEYAVMAEIMGRFGHMGSEVMNCSAPDTGNIEVLARYGNAEQQKRWLAPLLNGEIRSAFAMTERFGAFRVTDQRAVCQFGPTCKLHLPMPRTSVRLSDGKGTK
jgi:acyl-CoA dehydrogenase